MRGAKSVGCVGSSAAVIGGVKRDGLGGEVGLVISRRS